MLWLNLFALIVKVILEVFFRELTDYLVMQISAVSFSMQIWKKKHILCTIKQNNFYLFTITLS